MELGLVQKYTSMDIFGSLMIIVLKRVWEFIKTYLHNKIRRTTPWTTTRKIKILYDQSEVLCDKIRTQDSDHNENALFYLTNEKNGIHHKQRKQARIENKF